jgi:hypothetical protein
LMIVRDESILGKDEKLQSSRHNVILQRHCMTARVMYHLAGTIVRI